MSQRAPGPRIIRPWSDDEIQALRRDWQPGKSNNMLAARLQRTQGAVNSKAARLGLTERRKFHPGPPGRMSCSGNWSGEPP